MENYEQLLENLKETIKKDKADLDRINEMLIEAEGMREIQLNNIEIKYNLSTGLKLNKHQKLKLRVWLTSFGLEPILKAIEIYCNQYMMYDDDEERTYFTRGFSIIGGIAQNIKAQKG